METLTSLGPASELWLIQVPASVDVQALNGLRVRAGPQTDGQLRMQSSAGNFAWVDLEQQVTSVCLVPEGARRPAGSGAQSAGRFRAGPAFARRVVLYRTDDVPGVASSSAAGVERLSVPQLEGMRVRFRPIGDTARAGAGVAASAGERPRDGKKKRKERQVLPAGAPAAWPAPSVEPRHGEKKDKKEKKKEKERRRAEKGTSNGATPASEIPAAAAAHDGAAETDLCEQRRRDKRDAKKRRKRGDEGVAQ